MPVHYVKPNTPPECPRESLGVAPAILAKRMIVKPSTWCPDDIEFDPCCDPNNPKTVLPKDVYSAVAAISQEVPPTPLRKSKRCPELGLNVYYKLEFFNKTRSFTERGAHYVMQMLTDRQAEDGIFTASMGNWGRALAYKARRFRVPLTVVLPENTPLEIIEKIGAFGATAIKYGKTFTQAKKHAFVLKHKHACGIYINGYDHPHVIAACGGIGLEILEQLPEVDAILIPVGGGGLLAGIATVVKQKKPEVLIYGIEPNKCSSFFKAIENEGPYQTDCGFTMAESLAIPLVGVNAYHTAISLIDKMVLIKDDWISQAILHLAEAENIVTDGTGALTLSPLLTQPYILPELRGKTVVCLVTSSHIDNYRFKIVLERGLEIEGRIISLTVRLRAEDMKTRLRLFRVISNLRINILNMVTETATFLKTDVQNIDLHLTCEARDLAHACALKRVLTRIFPNRCDFLEEPFSPIPICICTPKNAL